MLFANKKSSFHLVLQYLRNLFMSFEGPRHSSINLPGHEALQTRQLSVGELGVKIFVVFAVVVPFI